MHSKKKEGFINFEMNNKEEKLEIHANKDGLLFFAKLLTDMIKKNIPHDHLMTENRGGGLSNEIIGEDNELINHIKIFYWS